MSNNPFHDPYLSPQHAGYAPGPLLPGQRPAVWTWYVVYCSAMAILYLLCSGIGILLLMMPAEMLEENDPEIAMVRIQGVIVLAMCLALFGLYAAAPFLPRAKWAWIYGFVTIGIGLTSCCTLPFSIMLLIQWIKPEVKAYFTPE